MPKKKSVKKIIKQKQKQSTKINITIDNSKKTTRRNTQQNPPKNTNRYDSMPTYHMFYNPPPTPLIQSNKEENKPNPLTKSVASQTYINKNNFETQTEPIPQTQSFETQTERQNAETQTEPKKIKIKISKIKTPSVNFETQTEPEPERHPIDTQTEAIPSSINFTTPTQENNLNSQVDLDSFSHPFSRYADLSARRTMTPQAFDELNPPTVMERVNQIQSRFKGENPLVKRGRPKGSKNKAKSPATDVKRFESPDGGNRRETTLL